LKKKIIIIALLGAILSIIIYINTRNNKINMVALGDGIALGMTPYNIEGYSYNDYIKEEYVNNSIIKNYYEIANFGKTVKELIYEIKENGYILKNDKKIEIQRAINEADILTVSIGMDELSEDKITKSIIKEYEKDIKELLNLIKKINHNKVIILGLYTIKKEEQLNIAKLNAIIRDAAITNNFNFIDINDILTEEKYYFNNESYYINYLGHKEIYINIKPYL